MRHLMEKGLSKISKLDKTESNMDNDTRIVLYIEEALYFT